MHVVQDKAVEDLIKRDHEVLPVAHDLAGVGTWIMPPRRRGTHPRPESVHEVLERLPGQPFFATDLLVFKDISEEDRLALQNIILPALDEKMLMLVVLSKKDLLEWRRGEWPGKGVQVCLIPHFRSVT